jgi:hypothetical protein
MLLLEKFIKEREYNGMVDTKLEKGNIHMSSNLSIKIKVHRSCIANTLENFS